MRLLKPLLIVVCLLPATVYSQEEFFGLNNGINLSFSWLNEDPGQIYGGSFHSKKGILLGFATTVFNYPLLNSYTIAAGKMFEPRKNSNFPSKPFVSISQVMVSGRGSYTGTNLGLSQCFFIHSPFAFSISGTLQLLFDLSQNKHFMDPVSKGFVLGYTQSFFNNKIVSPIAGVTLNFESEEDMLSMIHLGLNIRLDSGTYNSSVHRKYRKNRIIRPHVSTPPV